MHANGSIEHTGDAVRQDHTERSPELTKGSQKQLARGLMFGLAFGFLLQKGGVAKYHILMGVLLLEDFTVIQVMVSAIAVGMIGIFSMRAMGLIELHVKPTRYAANILGGLFFGVGFALLGYCPGTGAAALGQGNYDAIAGIMGMMVGSYVYAEVSGRLDRTVGMWGDCGQLTLPDLVPLPMWACVLVVALLLMAGLICLELAT